MTDSTILIFGNKIFLEIINEIKFFNKFKTKYYEDFNLCIKDAKEQNHLLIFFANQSSKNFYKQIEIDNFPIILVIDPLLQKSSLFGKFKEKLIIPFEIINLEKKIISLIAKKEFMKNSMINLNEYVIDRNERKIKKNKLELSLSEKEINFLVLFKESEKPITRDFVLKNVWHYSPESETHTIETHIHRLRKKILKKFGDNNFIKNNNKGYYI